MNPRKLFSVRQKFLARNADRRARGRDPRKLFSVGQKFLAQKFSRRRSQAATRKLFSVRQMFLGVFLGLGLGALFSSGCLVDLAERQGIGGTRDVALGAANAVDRAANFLSLNRPADGLSAALGRDTGGAGSEAAQELLASAMLPDPSRASNPEGTSPTLPPSGRGGERDSGEDGAGSGEGAREDGTTESTSGDGRTNPDGSTTTAPTSPPSTSSGEGTDGPTGKTDAATTSAPATGTHSPRTTEDAAPPGTAASPPTAPSTTTKATPPGVPGNRPAPNTTTITAVNPPTPPSPVAPTTTTAAANPPPSPDPPVCPSTQAENLPDEAFQAPRTPTPEAPLRIFVGGDSVSQSLAEGLQRLASRSLTKFEVASRVSTGLSRPDFYDWPARLARELTEDRPDVIVLMFGANDFQNVAYNGKVFNRFKQEWTDLYCQRVAQAMRLVSQPGVQIIWVGQPIVRESTLAGGLELLNSVYKAQALLHPAVTFIDTWTLFSTPDGQYAQSLGGVSLRSKDGVHMTIPGSNRLATPAWEQIAAAWGLES